MTKTTLPGTVELTKQEADQMRKLHDRRVGLDNFIQTIIQQGEARAAEIQAESREAFQQIAKAHGLDLDSVNYKVSDDGMSMIPVALKL